MGIPEEQGFNWKLSPRTKPIWWQLMGSANIFYLFDCFLSLLKCWDRCKRLRKKQNKTNPPFLLEAKLGLGTGADVEQMLGQSSQHKAGLCFPGCWPPGSILRIAHIFLGGQVPWPKAVKRSGYWESPMPTRPYSPSLVRAQQGLVYYDMTGRHIASPPFNQVPAHSFWEVSALQIFEQHQLKRIKQEPPYRPLNHPWE